MNTYFTFSQKIILMLILLTSSIVTNAQNHGAFNGIPMDGNIKSFSKQLKKLNFKYSFLDEDNNFYYYQGDFIEKDDVICVFCSKKSDTVYGVAVFSRFYSDDSWASIKRKYQNVSLDSKYISDNEEFFDEPYAEGDGHEIEAILSGHCHYKTTMTTNWGGITKMINARYENLFTHNPNDSNKHIPVFIIHFWDDRNTGIAMNEDDQNQK